MKIQRWRSLATLLLLASPLAAQVVTGRVASPIVATPFIIHSLSAAAGAASITTLPLSISPLAMIPAAQIATLVTARVIPTALKAPGRTVGAIDSLQRFTAGMETSRRAGMDDSAKASERFFDQSGNRGPPTVSAAAARAPAAPVGVKSVSVDTVRTAADLDRLIPNGINSDELKAELKRDVAKMAPYKIYTYRDGNGGSFTGIDLSASPNIVDLIPELQPHEVVLIKKLLQIDPDIRVLVREEGKTPDLVIGDRVVELKSVIGDFPMSKLVDKANTQVLLHGQRHGLGHGDMVLDLPEERDIPTAEVKAMLDAWQARTGSVVLDNIRVLSQRETKIFVRQTDGTYQLAGFTATAPLFPEAEAFSRRAVLWSGPRAGPLSRTHEEIFH